MLEQDEIKKYLRTNENGRLHHRESQVLEFKEQFNFAGLAEYFKDFAAFANNRGGLLIFGVTDSPNREAKGLSIKSLDQFDKIDPEKISGYLNDIFSGHIVWGKFIVDSGSKKFGAFCIEQSAVRPIIAKKDEGRDNTIKNGEIYFRYGGRTQKIEYSELEALINERIEKTNREWMDLITKIGKIGPNNAAIYDLESSILKKDDSKILVVDEDLSRKIQFIKEGEFDEKKGAPTLKLVGDVLPIDKVDVVKHVKENLLKEYPLTAMQLCEKVRAKTKCSPQDVWRVIRENNIKSDKEYSAYNFRNKKQEDEYKKDGKVSNNTPSIYKDKTVDYIVTLIRNEKG